MSKFEALRFGVDDELIAVPLLGNKGLRILEVENQQTNQPPKEVFISTTKGMTDLHEFLGELLNIDHVKDVEEYRDLLITTLHVLAGLGANRLEVTDSNYLIAMHKDGMLYKDMQVLIDGIKKVLAGEE